MKNAIAIGALFVSFSAFAAGADLRVSLRGPEIAARGTTWAVTAVVENAGADTASGAKLWFSIVVASETLVTCHEGTELGPLAPGEQRAVGCSATVPLAGPQIDALRAHASVHVVGDPHPQNNTASVVSTIASPGPDVLAYLTPLVRGQGLTPAIEVPVQLYVRNMSRSEARGITAVIEAPHGFGALPPECKAGGTRATCSLPNLSPIEPRGPSRILTLEVIAPDETAATAFSVRSDVSLAEEVDVNPENDEHVLDLETIRTVFVTSAADSGPGSLRAAIAEVNALPTAPTLIAFRMGRPEHRWHTIRPTSALPPLTASLAIIDGTTQRAYFGDSNPAGPEVEINGSTAPGANGLDLACAARVRGLAVNGFDGAGIVAANTSDCFVSSDSGALEGNFLGVDPGGTVAVPNGRGVLLSSGYFVKGNVISGNRRAGVFATGAWPRIEDNLIGLGHDGLRALPNGASGIYIGPDAAHAEIIDNQIAHNAECGLAIGWGAVHVHVRRNSFRENGNLGIDYGIDGPTPAGPVPVPQIDSATVSEGRTIIAGRIRRTSYYRVSFYANDRVEGAGFGEGQHFLGEVELLSGDAGSFRFMYDGDLRGKFVTATTTHLTKAPDQPTSFTSEFSRAIEVK